MPKSSTWEGLFVQRLQPACSVQQVQKLKELTRLLDNEPDISDFEHRLAHSAMADIMSLAEEA